MAGGGELLVSCTRTLSTHVVGEGLLEGEVGGDVRDAEPDQVPHTPGDCVRQKLEPERTAGSLTALLELLAGHQRPHHAQGQVEAEGRQHDEPGHQALLSLHLPPEPVQTEAHTPGIDPGHQDGGEVALVHLTVVVWEEPVLHVLEREGVEQQYVGDGHGPDQAEGDA